MAGMHPYQRYKILSDGWQDGWFMPRECVQLQWVGNYSAITPVFSGEMKLPHTPLHPLCLTSEDPLVMLNPL